MAEEEKPGSDETPERGGPEPQANVPPRQQATTGSANLARRNDNDPSNPLSDARLEAIAQFMALPKAAREFRSVAALAKHLNVSRMTLYRWQRALIVQMRAEFLSRQNGLAGVILARSSWEDVIQAQTVKALRGDMAAAKFLQEVMSLRQMPDNSPRQITFRVVYDEDNDQRPDEK